jgi:myo-inositol-1(or 4)-monophosphatase
MQATGRVMGYQSENVELLTLCTRAARLAADVIHAATPGIRQLDWRSKGPTDFVSAVDLAAEDAIIGVFAEELPEAAILAEESATLVKPDRLRRGLAVVVDPLDGTTNFLHGYPEYAVSIAVLRDGEPVAAVVHDVPGEEIFTAMVGGGAQLNGQKCAVSTIVDPQRALIGTGFPFKDAADIAPYQAQMSRVMAQVSGVRRPGAASIDLASVACGRFDAFWENMLSPWDFAAGMLLVREAGGLATDLDGEHLVATGPSSVLAGGPRMHAWLHATLR